MKFILQECWGHRKINERSCDSVAQKWFINLRGVAIGFCEGCAKELGLPDPLWKEIPSLEEAMICEIMAS